MTGVDDLLGKEFGSNSSDDDTSSGKLIKTRRISACKWD